MSFPPPPPPPPNQPPNDGQGGFGPPPGGYGAGGPVPGGYGQGGFPPPGGQPAGPPPGGFGPVGPGYGPAGPGGPGAPGGWQSPPPPPSGGGNGKIIAAIIGGGVLVLAVVFGVIAMSGGGDDDKKNRATPSRSTDVSPSATPDDGPTTATDFPSDPASASPSESTIPFFKLEVGDCYDLPADGSGNNDAASCDDAHDAEVVSIHQLRSGFTSSSDIKDEAAKICKSDLESKAARQPSGTAEGTYVQFPNLKGYNLGIKSVSCSLMGNRSGTKKLHAPLS
ncbi:hypothetical protein [Streptomyces sp. NPDC014733]|uniref:hypothetical protein n=1 Tax=Streptomyces sp. NPDC014733 TaxID=3364885 RepID=UPI0036F6D6F7